MCNLSLTQNQSVLLFLLYTSRKEKFFIEGLLIEGYMQDRDQIN